MKAKFDKIMSNFIDDSKQGGFEVEDYKNKNLMENVKGIIKQNSEEEEEEIDAEVEGGEEMSVNIKINNKRLFPTTVNNAAAKPPKPITVSQPKVTENRSSTPDREMPMRERQPSRPRSAYRPPVVV